MRDPFASTAGGAAADWSVDRDGGGGAGAHDGAEPTRFGGSRTRRRAHAFRTLLLHGVTGSGKTELYLRLAATRHRDGPARADSRAGNRAHAGGGRAVPRAGSATRVAIQHSGLSDGERHDQWHRIRRGDVDVVVGTRSAVFAPLDRIGLIVVDEEHDGVVQAGRGAALSRPRRRHRARTRARRAGRARIGDAVARVGDERAARAATTWSRLTRRILDRPLATVRIVDMREEYAQQGADVTLSRPLLAAIAIGLSRGEQTRGAAQPPRIRDRRLLPAVRRVAGVPALQRRRSRFTRRAGACGATTAITRRRVPTALRRVRRRVSRAVGFRHGTARGGSARARFRARASRASIATPIRRRGAIARVLAGRGARRDRHPRRHADDRQGPRFSGRHARRRRLGGRRPRTRGLPRGRADVPVADAGRRAARAAATCRARRSFRRCIRTTTRSGRPRRRTTRRSTRAKWSSARACGIRRPSR